MWTSDSSFACRSSSGFFSSGAIIASTSGSAGSISRALSYSAPIVLSISSSSVVSGSTVVMLNSLQLGKVALSQKSFLGASSCQSSSWFSDSLILCKSSAGSFFGLHVKISTSNVHGSLTTAFSYLSSFVSSSVGTNSPRSGSVSLTVIGVSFGAASYSQKLVIASSSAEVSSWVSASAVLGKAAMSSGNFLPLKVSLEMRSSLMSLAMSYDVVQPKMTYI